MKAELGEEMMQHNISFPNGIMLGSLRIAAILNVALLMILLFVGVLFIGTNPSNAESRSVFYRLKSSYLHGDERVDFNIVVGCAVHVTGYKDGSSSYDAFRDPVNYTKATIDGAAVMQLVPDACAGYTTASGEVPKDLLPGAIWFDSKSDLTLGIGYLSEDAYENPKSKLKFLGATIESATREEWEAFRPILIQNLLEPHEFVTTQPWPSETEVMANMWSKIKLAEWTRSSMECHGYARYRVEGSDVHVFLEQFRPKDKPRFWVPREEDVQAIGEYFIRPDEKDIRGRLDGHFWLEYTAGTSGAPGFPTRAAGGMILSNQYHRRASKLFPMKADDGVPWARPELQSASAPIYRDLELNSGANVGFTYCYSPYWGRGAIGDLHLPGYKLREKRIRVDGASVGGPSAPHTQDDHPADPPQWIVEETDYLYVSFRHSLN